MREREWGTKVIVLSGYNDFEYVRSMAVLGIENYLLKPVNEEELYATVSATLKKLDNEQALQMKEQLNADLIRENIINRWLYGSIGENELIERAEFLDFTLEAASYQPCIIRLLGTNEDKGSRPSPPVPGAVQTDSFPEQQLLLCPQLRGRHHCRLLPG